MKHVILITLASLICSFGWAETDVASQSEEVWWSNQMDLHIESSKEVTAKIEKSKASKSEIAEEKTEDQEGSMKRLSGLEPF